jgi:hypothetical protein
MQGPQTNPCAANDLEKSFKKMRYFIVHLHRLLDPLSQTPPR